jgi:heme-degrading monooxygenase HmoA
MFILHVEITVKPGKAEAMEGVYRETFRPAIVKQQGFHSVELLRSTENNYFLLSISFETDELRVQWVNSDLHQEVWPRMEEHFVTASLKRFVLVR